MLNFNNFQDNISNDSLDEQSEDIRNLLNISYFNLEECFKSILLKENLIDIESDIDFEYRNKNSKKNKSNNFFLSSKENSYPNINLINLNEDNKQKAIDKSKETSPKNENLNEKSNLSNISSISYNDEVKNNCGKNKLIISTSYDDLKQSENEKIGKDILSFLGKKRVLFEEFTLEDYSIFTYGEYNEYSKQIINEVIKEIIIIDKKKMKEIMNGEYQKKIYKKKKNFPKFSKKKIQF